MSGRATDLSMDLGGHPLRLCPERCAFRPDRGELLLADVHLGKASAFRQAGRPLPHGTTRVELARLDAAIERTGARRVTFLGDLFHGDVPPGGPTVERLSSWLRARRGLGTTLVCGNHDRHARERIESLPLAVLEEGEVVEGIEYRHHPLEGGDGPPHIAGHVHPGARIGDGADRVKLPVFRLRGSALLLPSFGSFTGLHVLAPEPGDRFVVATPTGVVEVPHRVLRSR